jgi:protein-S-isoprenylcysteine O-methyltransferase Ste14
VFWIAKARLEERLLTERFPEYAAYRRRTWF